MSLARKLWRLTGHLPTPSIKTKKKRAPNHLPKLKSKYMDGLHHGKAKTSGEIYRLQSHTRRRRGCCHTTPIALCEAQVQRRKQQEEAHDEGENLNMETERKTDYQECFRNKVD